MPSHSTDGSKRPSVGYGLVALGLLATVLGLLWNVLVPMDVYWSEQDAGEYNAAYEAAHTQSIPDRAGQPSSDPANIASDDLDEARTRLLEADGRLRKAQSSRANTGRILAIGGVMLAIFGVGLLRQGHGES